MSDLIYAMREAAHLYSAQKTDKPAVEVFTRWDGLDIPPSTHIEVIVRLVHDDRQVTPELEMAEFMPQPVYCAECKNEAVGVVYDIDDCGNGKINRYYCAEHAPKAVDFAPT